MKITGVSTVISAAHRSRAGNLHGHTWQVTVWFKHQSETDAERLSADLRHYAKMNFDHRLLPDELAWGEDLAEKIGVDFNAESVEVSRPLEGIYAKWIRD